MVLLMENKVNFIGIYNKGENEAHYLKQVNTV